MFNSGRDSVEETVQHEVETSLIVKCVGRGRAGTELRRRDLTGAIGARWLETIAVLARPDSIAWRSAAVDTAVLATSCDRPCPRRSDIRWQRPFRLSGMRICVFCGSKTGIRPEYVDAARDLGRILAERGITLVYGGASIGTMGTIADAALAAGGEVIGVIPQRLVDHEIAHRGLTELRIVADMHERKAQMAALADGFVALPGAAGTLEELFEVWTWGQLGLHLKPCGLLDVAGYYTKLREFLDHMVTEKFLVPRHRQMLTVQSDPLRLLEEFASYQAPAQKDALSRDALPPVDSLAWWRSTRTRSGSTAR